MGDLFSKLNQLKDTVQSNLPKAPDSKAGLLGAAGVGGVLGALFGGSKNVQRTAKNVAVIGGTAALAALAYKMYQKWQSSGQAATPNSQPQGGYGVAQQGGFGAPQGYGQASDDPFAAYNQQQQQQQLMLTNDMGKVLLEAMVFAARADGHIDRTAQQLSSDSNFNQLIREYLSAPLDPRALAQKVSSREQALDVYRLSAAAIVADNVQEQNYLLALAGALQIDSATKAQLDQEAVQIREQISRS